MLYIVSRSNWLQVFGDEPTSYAEFIKHVHPEDLNVLAADINKALSEQVPFFSRFRFTRPDNGETRFIETRGAIRQVGENRIQLSGVAMDVTERVNVEEAYQDSIREFATLTESLPNIVWTANAEGKLVYLSPRWTEYTGLPGDQSLGDKWEESIHPEDLVMIMQSREERLRKGVSDPVELRIKDKFGEYRWFLGHGQPFYSSRGKILKWFGTFTTIEDQKRAQKAVETSLNARDQFISMASHELKTPIAALKLHLNLLWSRYKSILQEADDSGEIGKILRISIRQVDHLIQLIENLLDVSVVSSSTVQLNKEVANISLLVEDVIAKSKETLDRAGCEVITNIEPKVSAQVDKLKFEQLLINLLSNAVKYAPGGPVTVQLKCNKKHVLVSVKDSGPGVEPEWQDRIFNLFVRTLTANRPKVSGLGIGLFVARQIATAHGGHLTISSIPGKGANFTIKLPLT